MRTCSFSPQLRASQLCWDHPQRTRVWKDPEFDPAARAFYYTRVQEIPTPRWTAYDSEYFKVKMDPKVPMTTRERA